MAIMYALFCLCFSGVNDFVFKLYARKIRSLGWFVAVIGVVWMGVLLLQPLRWQIDWGATLFWGGVSGVFSVGGNLLLIAAMSHLGGGLCATIYRLNLVPVVIGASWLLHEALSWSQWCGVVLALMAVLAFLPFRELRGAGGKGVPGAFIMVICASLMRAGMGLSYRFGFLHGADRGWVTVLNAVFWIVGGVFYAVRYERDWRPAAKTVRYGLLSGGLVAGIIFCMAASLQYGAAAVVLPIAQMSFLPTYVLGVVFLHEKLSSRVGFALLCGAGAILLLTIGRGGAL